MEICAEYGQLLDRLINRELPVDEFQAVYLKKFKGEKRPLRDGLHDLLQGVFGDVDSFTRDPHLHQQDPQFYLDENRLRERIRNARNLLRSMQE